MICEKCNSEMIYFTKFQSCGWKCPKCNWSFVTSNIDPKDMDDTQYTLTISACKTADKLAIRTMSKAGKLSVVEARNAILSGYTFTGLNARDTAEIAKALAECGINHTILPVFPYEY
ncbi:MAG: hypothetical protein HUJ72_04690 [Blautia sp.]|nr:hypothetical protein [Blautia sp.]